MPAVPADDSSRRNVTSPWNTRRLPVENANQVQAQPSQVNPSPRVESQRPLGLGAAARVLLNMARGMRSDGDQASRLTAFYAPQAQDYDAFRDRLLHGRQALIDALLRHLPEDRAAHIVELGAGTGRNLDFFGAALSDIGSVELVDICAPLLAIAHNRIAVSPWKDTCVLRTVHADVTRHVPAQAADCVYFSYSLSMIPSWARAIDNALAMLRPGGIVGVVDFHLPEGGGIGNALWQRWFAHDGVYLSGEHLPFLRTHLTELACTEARGAVPFLPGIRVPYYVFVGRKRS